MQIGLVDESSVVCFATSLTGIMVISMLACGLTDVVHPGHHEIWDDFPLALTTNAICGFALVYAIFRSFDPCIRLNYRLQQDGLALARAAVEVLHNHDHNEYKETHNGFKSTDMAAHLHALQRKVQSFDRKVSFWGVPITRSLRNHMLGAVASTTLTGGIAFLHKVRTWWEQEEASPTSNPLLAKMRGFLIA